MQVNIELAKKLSRYDLESQLDAKADRMEVQELQYLMKNLKQFPVAELKRFLAERQAAMDQSRHQGKASVEAFGHLLHPGQLGPGSVLDTILHNRHSPAGKCCRPSSKK